jgi:Superfamily II DNA and RNA helicases
MDCSTHCRIIETNSKSGGSIVCGGWKRWWWNVHCQQLPFTQQQEETKATSKDGLFYSSLQQDILDSQATIIGGTPKALLQIMSEWEKSHQLSLSSSQTSWLWNQVTTVVLEESDQLFKTELVARGYKMKKEDCPTMQWLDKLQRYSAWGYNGYKNSRSSSSSSSSRKKKKKEKQPMGLVCVSATVGRTLRRQIMEITGAPSMDKAAVLITADDRTKKDARRRQKSLLPDTIEHCYAVYEKGGEQQKGGEEVEGEDLVDAICQVIQTQSLARTLIFPGKLGVVKMVQALQRWNLNNVITLRDEVHLDQSAEENAVRDEDDGGGGGGGGGGWESTPIYVVGEKFGRGLDIAHVSYVFLAAPPNSAAAYTHLAGRTGRGNHRGRAITMVQGMEEARRLASLSHTLGIPFVPLTFDEPMNGHVPDASRDELQTALEHGVLDGGDEDGAKSMMNYEDMTVNQLKDILRDKGLKVSGRKNELIDRLKDSIL